MWTWTKQHAWHLGAVLVVLLVVGIVVVLYRRRVELAAARAAVEAGKPLQNEVYYLAIRDAVEDDKLTPAEGANILKSNRVVA